MSTRSVEIATGREFALSIEKTGNPVIIGCASSVDYSAQSETLTANCQNGKKQIVSGDDPTYTLTVQGFVSIYSGGAIATNISSTEIETYLQTKALINWAFNAPHTGDPTREGTGYITAFSLSAPVDGIATYNFTITPFEMPTLGVVA